MSVLIALMASIPCNAAFAHIDDLNLGYTRAVDLGQHSRFQRGWFDVFIDTHDAIKMRITSVIHVSNDLPIRRSLVPTDKGWSVEPDPLNHLV